jgi:hypothetical protein
MQTIVQYGLSAYSKRIKISPGTPDPEKADRKMHAQLCFGMEEVLRRLAASTGLGSVAAPCRRSVEPAGGLAGISRRKR